MGGWWGSSALSEHSRPLSSQPQIPSLGWKEHSWPPSQGPGAGRCMKPILVTSELSLSQPLPPTCDVILLAPFPRESGHQLLSALLPCPLPLLLIWASKKSVLHIVPLVSQLISHTVVKASVEKLKSSHPPLLCEHFRRLQMKG